MARTWTIEDARKLPVDNWLGVKRIGEHAWQIGQDDADGKSIIMHTGDGGVVEYLNTLMEVMEEPVQPGLLEQVRQIAAEPFTFKELTYSNLAEMITEIMLKDKEDGLAKN